MIVSLLGKRWRIRRTWLKDHFGDCSAPHTKNKEIRVHSQLKGQKELEVYLHEMLHACNWHLDEEWIEAAGHDLARALWRLGYRRNDDIAE